MRATASTFIFLLLVNGVALADEQVTTPPPVVEVPASSAPDAKFGDNTASTIIGDLPALPADRASSQLRADMLEELRLVREQEAAQVAELVAELESAASEDRIDLQRRISEIKSDAYAQSLNIQLEFARRGGHEELVQRLEIEVEQFELQRTALRGTINTESTRQRPVPGGESR